MRFSFSKSVIWVLSFVGLMSSGIVAYGFSAPEEMQAMGQVQRARTFTTDVQTRLARSPALAHFNDVEGVNWRAVFDEVTGTPHRMWGDGIDIGATDTADQVSIAILNLVDRHPDLFGIADSQVGIKSTRYNQRLDTWYVDIDQFIDGYPIYRSGLTARIKHGNLIMLGADTYPGISTLGPPRIDQTKAVSIATSQGPAPTADHQLGEVSLVVVPLEAADGVELRTAYLVQSKTTEPVGQWVTFIDAEHGDVLAWYNNVKFSIVEGIHEERTLNDPMITSGMPYIEVHSSFNSVYADEEGLFSIEGDDREAELEGSYLNVRNSDGPEGDISFSADGLFTDSDATQAEISTYVFVHQIQAWGLSVAPEVEMSSYSLRSSVNVDGSCNAYYDGNLNFYRSGNGCNNTAQIADVNYHEWGHGFHYYSLEAGSWDGSVGEGSADVIAFLQTGDSHIGPYFYTGGGSIRDHAPNKEYPDDYNNDQNYVHSNGLIFGGAIWDLWNELVDIHGETEGTARVTDIFTGLLKGGPDVEGSYYEAIVADDDDGDLNNGTPNYCQIVAAFELHGLGPGVDGAMMLDHDQVVSASADIDIPITMTLSEASCSSADIDNSHIIWRANGGEWQTSPLSSNNSEVDGVIPAQPLGTFIEYYLTIESSTGGQNNSPVGGEIAPFTTFVGGMLPIVCEDFESSDAGFSHELVEGEWAEGADDWQWGQPQGESGDPSTAWSGDMVWGNDLGDDNYNGAYQDDKYNRLTTPTIELAHYDDVFLHYRRWLNVEDGVFDQALITADDAEVWGNFQSGDSNGESHHEDYQWIGHSVPLAGSVEDHQVSISFELITDGGLSFGGWTIDDFCLMAPDTADNRLGISDFVATDDTDADKVLVSFTNPIHEPLSSLVVVRRTDRYPTGPEDGVVIYEDDSPSPGALTEFSDPEPDKLVYYAMYAFDGQEWLSWTRVGFNADTGIASGDGVEETTDSDPVAALKYLQSGGCSCSATSSGLSIGFWLLGLLPVVLVRRGKTEC